MRIQGAIIEEQHITFAIVIVKRQAMQTPYDSDKTRAAFQGLFSGLPLILASQDCSGYFHIREGRT